MHSCHSPKMFDEFRRGLSLGYVKGLRSALVDDVLGEQ